MRRSPLGGIGLALAVAGGVWLSAWSLHYFRRYQPLADLMAGAGAVAPVGLQVNAAEAVGRVGGRRRWRVSARQITFSQDQRQVVVEGLHHGVFFDARERPLARLSAGTVLYQSPTPVFGAGDPQGTLQIGGGLQVHLLGRYGPTVSTASLSWDPARGVVRSLAPVSAQFPARAGAVSGAQLMADGVQWDTRRGLLQSPGHVQVVFAGGAGNVAGEDVTVDLHTSDLTLRRLHGTFTLPHGVQQPMAAHSLGAVPFLAGLLLAATPAGTAPPNPKPTHDVIYDSGASTYLDKPHVALMSEGVHFNQDDAYLVTQAAVVHLDDEGHALNAASRAPVHLWDPQNDLTGQHGEVDFTRRIATIKDSVTLVVKPGPQNTNAPKGSLKSKFKDPATLTCALMTYDYRRKYGTVPGTLTIHQKDRVLTADSGTYDGRAQIITLTGHVHGYDHYRLVIAPFVIFGVREGDEFIRIDAPSHGIFKQAPDDDKDDDAPPSVDPNAYDTLKNGGAASILPAPGPDHPPAPNNGGGEAEPAPAPPPPPAAPPAPASGGATASPPQ